MMRWWLVALLTVSVTAFAQDAGVDFAAEVAKAGALPQPSQMGIVPQVSVLMLLALMPFAVLLLTSFTKIAVVLSLLRSALGTQSAPPTMVITGLASLLTIYVMFPTALAMYNAAEKRIHNDPPDALLSGASALYIYDVVTEAREPLRNFLKANTQPATMQAYYQTAQKILPAPYKETMAPDDFLVLMPSYITGQLKSAFEVGVLIYLPFFVIDLVVSNILLAMGMMMLSPLTIALPLKILLLVMVDGWTLLLQGLVASYTQPGA
jgi:type III secretion protein R